MNTKIWLEACEHCKENPKSEWRMDNWQRRDRRSSARLQVRGCWPWWWTLPQKTGAANSIVTFNKLKKVATKNDNESRGHNIKKWLNACLSSDGRISHLTNNSPNLPMQWRCHRPANMGKGSWTASALYRHVPGTRLEAPSDNALQDIDTNVIIIIISRDLTCLYRLPPMLRHGESWQKLQL